MPVESCGRRSRGLADIAPQYIAKSGLCAATEMESARGGSIRIQHLTGATAAGEGRSRFPKLDECAHFHYEAVELGPLQVCLYEEELKPLWSEDSENKWWHVSVTSQGKSWVIRRSYDNFRLLDQQLHRCIYDRKFSGLPELPPEGNVPGTNQEESTRRLLSEYLSRFSQLATSTVNCGPVLNWLELDNRGHRLLVPDGDSCPINTPAVAAAYAIRRYQAQAGDEISFEVGDMISVIDMPPPEESIWWRGKRGFHVGFFPSECVAVIGDKVPRSLPLPQQQQQQAQQQQQQEQRQQPSKPVLRKHGKLIAFFRSFILARPSRRRLRQSGILKERVFGCDLGEHLLNSGHDVPMVLKCCAEFIESNGIVDGIYRLSGVTSNIQKLRNAFDEDRVPALYEDEAILQDIHSVASLLKMYFRELPNPLCTYQLYHTFVGAVQAGADESGRLARMRDAVHKLPPPHYRTLQYLVRHLARVASRGHLTGMTPRNVAIVWAPNLLRCKELEVGGVAALQGVGVQAVVTEFLVCYADLIFCDGLPAQIPITRQQSEALDVPGRKSRPKSLAISTPTKLLSLEEARSRALMSSGKGEPEYIEVGGGPASLPAKYHTVIELPGGGSARKRSGSKRSPLGWKSFFSKSGRKTGKATTPSDLVLNQATAVTEADLSVGRRRLRPVKSAESLANSSSRNSAAVAEADVPLPVPICGVPEDLVRTGGHSRSVSHDSYFDQLAETPARSRAHARPSRLAEEEREEHFSSSLDLSEIQLNFELEETEMRIFSEDETLLSVGSGSLVSQGSPRIWPGAAIRRGSVIGEASPKRQQRPAGPPSPRSKRSRLEQRLGCSPPDELRYIDSQSPDVAPTSGIGSGQQVTVQAEVHPLMSPPSTPGYHPLLDSSPETPDPDRPAVSPHVGGVYQDMSSARSSSTYRDLSGDDRSPTYHEMSDTRSTCTHLDGSGDDRSPGVLYEELVDKRSSGFYSNVPNGIDAGVYQNITNSQSPGAYCAGSSPDNIHETYVDDGSKGSPERHVCSASDSETAYQDTSTVNTMFCGISNNKQSSTDDVSERSSTLDHCVVSEENKKDTNWNITDDSYEVSGVQNDVGTERMYENIPCCDSDWQYEALATTSERLVSDAASVKSDSIAENEHVTEMTSPTKTLYQNVTDSASLLMSPFDNTYQNLSNNNTPSLYQNMVHKQDPTVSSSGIYQNLKQREFYEEPPEEHVYEDVRPLDTDGIDLYQQVKTLRRSVHEVNQLLGESTDGDRRIIDSPTEHSNREISVDSSSSLDVVSDILGSESNPDSSHCEIVLNGNTTERTCVPEYAETHLPENGDQQCESDFIRNSSCSPNTKAVRSSNSDLEENGSSVGVDCIRDFGSQENTTTGENQSSCSKMMNDECFGSVCCVSDGSPNSISSTTDNELFLQVTCLQTGMDEDVSSDLESEKALLTRTEMTCDINSEAYRLEDVGSTLLPAPSLGRISEQNSTESDSPVFDTTAHISSLSQKTLKNSSLSPSSKEEESSSKDGEEKTVKDVSLCPRSFTSHQDSESRLCEGETSEGSIPSAESSPNRRKRGDRESARTRSNTSFLETNLDSTSDVGDSSGSSPVRETSPSFKESLDNNRRRFESEIGREILRERRMRQELEEIRSQATAGQGRTRRPVRSLPTRSGDSLGTSQPLPPCVRAREARARRQLSSGSLSSSLDGGHFPSSVLVRATTSPDVNLDSSQITQMADGSVTTSIASQPPVVPHSVPEDDDPQRRERIERYKQERRTFLREKYRSESFRGERDEVLQRLKKRAGRTSTGASEQPSECDVEKSGTPKERLREIPMGDTECNIRQLRDRESRRGLEGKVCDTIRVKEKGPAEMERVKQIGEEEGVETRTHPGRARHRVDEESQMVHMRRSSAPQQSGTCIRNMAAIFEPREIAMPASPTAQTGKTYVSSV